MPEQSSRRTASRVLEELHQRSEFGHAEATIRDLASALGIGRSTASRALRLLADEGVITKESGGTGDGYPTVWRIQGGAR